MSKPETSNVKTETSNPKVEAIGEIRQITQESLAAAWSNFADTVKNDTRLHSILSAYAPSLTGETKIIYQLSNDLQREPFQKIETKLLQHLQAALCNKKMEIEIVLAEKSETSAKAYTAEEKFAEMERKNPALIAFRQQFMLDFV